MLILIPIFLLLAAAAAILILHQIRPNYGYLWLIAVGTAVVVWIFFIALRWQQGLGFSIEFRPLGASQQVDPLFFQLDAISWPFAFSLASLLLAVILIASGRMQLQSTPTVWVFSLSISAAAILTVLSGNPTTFILTWSLIDLIEFFFALISFSEEKFDHRLIYFFALRILGTMLLAWAMIFSLGRGIPLSFSLILPEVKAILVLAALLRMSILPLRPPYFQRMSNQRELGTLLRLIAPASSVVFLSRFSGSVLGSPWGGILTAFSVVAALYGAASWLGAADEMEGRPYLLIAFSGLILASVIRGQSTAVMAWGTAMILSGALIFLDSLRHPRLLLLPLLGILGISGLPFTPAASGWVGLAANPFRFSNGLLLLAQVLLQMGYLRHALRLELEAEKQIERWVLTLYTIGFGVLLISQVYIGVIGWQGSLTPGVIWASGLSFALAAGGTAVLRRSNRPLTLEGTRIRWVAAAGQRTAGFLSSIFSLEWLEVVFRFFYNFFRQIFRFGADILEGDSGVLWALLLLALLISLALPGGG